jgi:glycerophosphoryl diester phosphodiesterase
MAREVEADEIALHYRLVNKRIVELALEKGFAVVVWTVDDPKWIKTARLLKVSAVITNNPKLLVVQRNS